MMNLRGSNEFWKTVRQQARVWRTGVLPGAVVIACVMIARATGSLQVLEWMAFDQLLRSRPLESADPQIVIVGINEVDIKKAGKYPIPDPELAKALKMLQVAKPRVIGLDLFRDLNSNADRAELAQVFRTSPNLIGIEAGLGSKTTLTVSPPPELPANRVGLADALIDPDGKLRRGLLASKTDSGEVKYSLPLLAASLYLRTAGVELHSGQKASDSISLGTLPLPRVQSNTGGYINAKAGGNQILLNFRSHPQPFRILSMTDILRGNFQPEWIRDRIVLIGMTAASVNDTFMTSATQGTLLSSDLDDPEQYQFIYGVEYQAHAISQLINAVLEGRSLLHTWVDGLEYLWIMVWGLIGIALGLILQSPWKTLLSLALSSVGLIGICYGLLVSSWWVPLVPALLALCAAGLTTSFFDRDFRILLEQRSLTLQRTYDAVHNGPLQTLAAILRNLDESANPSLLRSHLHALNQELRSVYESMYQALLTTENAYSEKPIYDLLYTAYDDTLQRDLPGFASIKTFIAPDFTPLQDCSFTPDQKQALCVFLQEALCNVGKHAIAASYLDVVCQRKKKYISLQIIDNGTQDLPEFNHGKGGRGTDQAEELARSLGGSFQRRPNPPHGVVCELTWTIKTSLWKSVAKVLRTEVGKSLGIRRQQSHY